MIDPLEDRYKTISKKTAAEGEKFEEIQLKSASERNQFFEKLALLDGGAIVVSVTFLGYLLPKQDAIRWRYILHGSWLLLLLSLLACLLRIFFYQNYAYYSHAEPYLRRWAEKSEVEAQLGKEPNQLFVSGGAALSEAERTTWAELKLAQAENLRKEADKSTRRAQINKRVWRPCEYIALVALCLGLVMLVVFALKNSR